MLAVRKTFSLSLKALCLISMLPGAPFPAAESSLSVGMNLHAGLQLVQRKDELSPVNMGLGLEVGKSLPWGRLSAEGGFLYKAGSQYLLDASLIALPAGATLERNASKDSRKNQVDVYFLRLAYEKPLQSVTLHAGLELASTNFRQEYIADVRGAAPGGDFRDTYNGVLNKRRLEFNPFVGIGIPLDTDQELRVTLTTFQYTAVDYAHMAGTVADTSGNHTGSDSVQERKRTLPRLELSYAFRF